MRQCEVEAVSRRFNDPCYMFFETTKGFRLEVSQVSTQNQVITYEQFVQGTKTKKGPSVLRKICGVLLVIT